MLLLQLLEGRPPPAGGRRGCMPAFIWFYAVRGGVGWLVGCTWHLLVLDYILRVHGSFVSRRNVRFLLFGGVDVLAARLCPPPPLSVLRRPRPKWWSALVLQNAATAVAKKLYSPKESELLPRGHTFSQKVRKKYFPPLHTTRYTYTNWITLLGSSTNWPGGQLPPGPPSELPWLRVAPFYLLREYCLINW